MLLIPVGVSGTAYFATNTVDPSYAGTAEAPAAIPTSLVADHASIADPEQGDHTIVMAATLTDRRQPLSGLTVMFSAGHLTCHDVTDSSGVASCEITTLRDVPSAYAVSFGGNGALQPSHDTAPVGGSD